MGVAESVWILPVGQTKINFGTAEIELRKANFHSNEGDLFIYLRKKKVLMAIDTLAPGYVPFMNFDLTVNMHEYLKMLMIIWVCIFSSAKNSTRQILS